VGFVFEFWIGGFVYFMHVFLNSINFDEKRWFSVFTTAILSVYFH